MDHVKGLGMHDDPKGLLSLRVSDCKEVLLVHKQHTTAAAQLEWLVAVKTERRKLLNWNFRKVKANG